MPLLSPIWSQKEGGRDWAFDISAIYEGAEDGVDTSQLYPVRLFFSLAYTHTHTHTHT